MIEHTYIEFMGLELADPLTFISDILMAVVCAILGHKLYHNFDSAYAKLSAFFFLFLGLSSFLGGSSHLFDLYLGKKPHLVAWSIQGVSILLLQLASLTLLSSNKLKLTLKVLFFGFFGVFISQIVTVQHFDVVKVNSIVGLIGFVSVIHICKFFEYRDFAYLRIPICILLFALPALIHSFGIYYNKWIDQNVISHLLLLPCYYLLYTSIKKVIVLKSDIQLEQQAVPLKQK